MRNILAIADKELRSYFASPIAYIMIGLFSLLFGVFFGWTVVRALRSVGITEFALPGGQLVIFVVFAALAGILAAVLPGRRAARIDVLRAITTE